jgi:hypothetical protein
MNRTDLQARRAAAWDAALSSRWVRVFDLAARLPWESRRGRVARSVAPAVAAVGMTVEAWRIRLVVR